LEPENPPPPKLPELPENPPPEEWLELELPQLELELPQLDLDPHEELECELPLLNRIDHRICSPREEPELLERSSSSSSSSYQLVEGRARGVAMTRSARVRARDAWEVASFGSLPRASRAAARDCSASWRVERTFMFMAPRRPWT